MELTNELFKQQVRAGSRTYFMDVKEAKNGKPYLSIQESRKKEEGFEKSRLLVFPDHLEEFLKGLDAVRTFINAQQPTDSKSEGRSLPPSEEDEELPF
jgi:hypothetical protein